VAVVLHKARWNLAEHGLGGVARLASEAAWRKLFRDREHLFFVAADAVRARAPLATPGIRFERFTERCGLPQRYLPGLRAGIRKKTMPESTVDRYLRRWLALFDEGAHCWAAVDGDHVAAFIFTVGAAGRYAQHFPAFPLFPGDVLMFGAWTDPAFRGRGLYRALVSGAFAQLEREGARRFFARTKIWNAASIRALRHVGMQSVAEYRYLKVFGRSFVVWRASPSRRMRGACAPES
jgi:RimJ/RimL family protein N-acetyltransferase